ncbi:3-deoxy-manno-octulosonate cytidylyltransferase [Aurantimonas sp. VKM B-3413]|uniref:3-deoxy-manno-octulosonate cytidylyltransferase n=1 Tax=Aurantimonas sp. VKM B-3413 TaxID=2779401 RepID=UPI001E31ED3F|nr:3-deoxy-manno-octulosonate cytidylyltransferase [Aurantimonas sp. VKM B-3413]MCB8837077.1 3-deoxy-manno-octulosonate cytidylyltransferase [Aurantimonas sp. VKM B-3413]
MVAPSGRRGNCPLPPAGETAVTSRQGEIEETGDEGPGMTTGSLPSDREGWAAFFSGYSRIVLVANSEQVDIVSLRARYAEDTLFVFFNKVFKVLSEPFEGNALIVARSSPSGANIVYRREVDAVLRLLRGPGFRGIANLRAGPREVFSRREEFGDAEVGFLDLCEIFDDFYPRTHVPTSGFALAFWLSEACPSSRVVLAGFSSRRSDRWKLFHDHDWTFEQILQRLLIRTGALDSDGRSQDAEGVERIAARFPQFSPAEIAVVSAQVLSERLEGTNMAIDRLMSLTRLHGRIDGFFRRIKPKTRKQKASEIEAKEARGDRPTGG